MTLQANPDEINFEISPQRTNTQQFSPTQHDIEERKKDYIVPDNNDLLDFSSFQGDPVHFILEGEKTLIIKEYQAHHAVTDEHLIKLQKLYSKLSNLSSMQKIESVSVWEKFSSRLYAVWNSIKCKPKHLQIKRIIINLSKCAEVGDKGVKALADFIKNFENIEHLEIEMNNTNVTDDSFAYISSLLASLKHITYFYLDFSGCKICDEGLYVLSNILKTKGTLREIWLRFSWCTLNRISNDGIISIAKSVESCRKLNVLLLEFNGNYDITSKGLSAVFGAAKALNSLRKLYLYFERAQATDNFLVYAGDVLAKLKSLTVFGLNLSGSSCLTAKGFEKLEKALYSLVKLRNGLYLYFNGCLAGFEQDKIRRSMDTLVKKRRIKNNVLEFA